MASRQQLQGMADLLISTLNTSMDSDKADAIVRDVALELYNDVLGIPGKIEAYDNGLAHGNFGPGKRVMHIAKYRFKKEKV